jgi:outer membrane protein TolC
MRHPLTAALLLVLATPVARAEGSLSIEQAIRSAWSGNAGLAASAAQVEGARLDASAARDAMLPTLETSARAIVTNEPLMAFGLKLDEGRLGTQDFDPARLNNPSATGGVGFGVSLKQPIYSGGRIDAGRRAADASAQAEAQSHEARRQRLAAEVVRAYFGAQVAAQAVRYAESALAQAQETERFVRARVAQQLLLESEALRATAFRAQREAELAAARQQAESARSSLELLIGQPVTAAALSSAVEKDDPGDAAAAPAETPALRAMLLRSEAARAAGESARGSLLPEVFLQLGAETLRSSFSQGDTWASAMIGARWTLSLRQLHTAQAAEARSEAAATAARWQGQEEAREVADARGAIAAAQSRVASAREAVAASESVRTQRAARHREGLLPLTDLLDAETSLSGARTLLLQSQLEARLAHARLALSSGQPVEGVRP